MRSRSCACSIWSRGRAAAAWARGWSASASPSRAQAGYAKVVLWTNDCLVAARRLYEKAGFTLVESEAHRSFGKDLVGQYWSLDLA